MNLEDPGKYFAVWFISIRLLRAQNLNTYCTHSFVTKVTVHAYNVNMYVLLCLNGVQFISMSRVSRKWHDALSWHQLVSIRFSFRNKINEVFYSNTADNLYFMALQDTMTEFTYYLIGNKTGHGMSKNISSQRFRKKKKNKPLLYSRLGY